MTTFSLQKVYYRAKKTTGIKKGYGIHTLRHCFATHLLDQGVDIMHIKHMLGHSSLKTTEGYLRLSACSISAVKSPLDNLLEQ